MYLSYVVYSLLCLSRPYCFVEFYFFLFFFFKQKTAYEMRISDWSSDVCSSDLEYPYASQINRAVLAAAWQFRVRPPRRSGRLLVGSWVRIRKIGRASCRERVCQYV